jgi:hypothetical protein
LLTNCLECCKHVSPKDEDALDVLLETGGQLVFCSLACWHSFFPDSNRGLPFTRGDLILQLKRFKRWGKTQIEIAKIWGTSSEYVNFLSTLLEMKKPKARYRKAMKCRTATKHRVISFDRKEEI